MRPERDGIDLMREVPELADVPVIFISGYGRDETVAAAFEAGAADYIVKPFSATTRPGPSESFYERGLGYRMARAWGGMKDAGTPTDHPSERVPGVYNVEGSDGGRRRPRLLHLRMPAFKEAAGLAPRFH